MPRRHTRVDTFSFESEVADGALEWTQVRVRADVLAEHAGLFAANPALLTHILAPTSASDIHVLLVGLVPVQQDVVPPLDIQCEKMTVVQSNNQKISFF